MSISKKLIFPGILSVTALAGVTGGSLLSSLVAHADTATTDSATSSGTSSDTSSTTASSGTASSSQSSTQPDPSQGGNTANGITETVLTGDDLTKATAAAQAAESEATVVRAETDAEGAKYEVHMKKSDGSMVTVKLDASFKVTSTEDGI